MKKVMFLAATMFAFVVVTTTTFAQNDVTAYPTQQVTMPERPIPTVNVTALSNTNSPITVVVNDPKVKTVVKYRTRYIHTGGIGLMNPPLQNQPSIINSGNTTITYDNDPRLIELLLASQRQQPVVIHHNNTYWVIPALFVLFGLVLLLWIFDGFRNRVKEPSDPAAPVQVIVQQAVASALREVETERRSAVNNPVNPAFTAALESASKTGGTVVYHGKDKSFEVMFPKDKAEKKEEQ